jgi:hypothetical protein
MVTNIEAVVLDAGAGAPSTSGVSWPAVLAGAVVAAATTLLMLALGAGLGFASLNPWPNAGASVAAVTAMAGIWLIMTQWAAAGVGGYITGRLRTRWASTHTHEVFFRDTAHGFITWSLATVVVACVVGAAGIGVIKTAGSAADGAYAYEIDSLFRSTQATSAPAPQAEVGRILARSVADGKLSDQDKAYLRDLAAARTGLTPDQAAQRVDALAAETRTAADKTRKAASAAAFFTALSMLIGAFVACVGAALGGQQRDLHP